MHQHAVVAGLVRIFLDKELFRAQCRGKGFEPERARSERQTARCGRLAAQRCETALARQGEGEACAVPIRGGRERAKTGRKGAWRRLKMSKNIYFQEALLKICNSKNMWYI